MKKTTIWAIIVVAIIVIAGVIVWNYNKPEKATDLSQPKETLKIGVMTPLTGFIQENGQNVKNGIDLALEKIKNDNPGLDIELLYEDDKCDAKEGVTAYNNLVKIKGVKMIIGTVCSAVTLAIAPLAEADKVVIISTASSSPTITNSGDYIFRVYPSDDLDAELLSKFAQQKGKKVAVVSINIDYGLNILNKIQSILGNDIVANEKFESGSTDFRSILTKVKFAKPDSIIFVAYPDNILAFLKQAKELNLEQPIIGSSPTFIEALFSEKYNNFYFTTTNTSAKAVKEFAETYLAKYNKKPGYVSDYGYDSLLSMFYAWQRAKNADQVKDALYKTNFNGATGEVKFDANGDRLGVTLGVYNISESKQLTCIAECN